MGHIKVFRSFFKACNQEEFKWSVSTTNAITFSDLKILMGCCLKMSETSESDNIVWGSNKTNLCVWSWIPTHYPRHEQRRGRMLLKPWLVHQGKFGWPSGIHLMGELADLKGVLCDGRPSGLGRSVNNKISVHYWHCSLQSRFREQMHMIRKPRGKKRNIESREERDRHLEKRR